ncbi:MAG: hypothetical protein ABIL40_11650 [candidate division WOR-3 bacterium]
MTASKFIGQILIGLGVITHSEVIEARRVQVNEDKGKNKMLGEIMMELGYITEKDLQHALNIQKTVRNKAVET